MASCCGALGQNLDNPTAFFTNVASALLQSDLKVSLTNIPIYPTNQYTPAVHRLLQVTANIYGATTNSPYPVIYRPHFSSDGTNIFISGYEEVDALDGTLLGPPLDLNDPSDRALISTDTRTNIYGIPWIFSAKKGLPNFNELSVDSFFQVTRRLQISRTGTGFPFPPISSYRIQQEFLMGISNVLGVEFWNSYRTNFQIPVEIDVAGDMIYSLTNSDGIQVNNRVPFTPIATNVNAWPGVGPDVRNPAPQSFIVPTRTNFVIVPTLAYVHSLGGFFNNTNSAAFEPVVTLPVAWGLSVTNHIRVLIREATTGRVLDYVQLSGPSSYRNLSEEIRTPNSAQYFAGLWSTNLTGTGLPWSIQQQLDISLGNNGPQSDDWNSYGMNQPTGPSKELAIDNFRAFYHLSPIYGQVINNTNLIQLAPFTPTRIAQITVSWQANDPLVHYTPEDLTDIALVGAVNFPSPNGAITSLASVGALNNRYNPWGGNPISLGGNAIAYNAKLKDSLVRSSDDWNFPNGEPLSVATLARIHRGTPWQTIYLKTDDVTARPPGQQSWRNWLGVSNNTVALQMAPKRDWRLASRIARMVNTNDVHKLFSPSDTNPNHWLSLFKPLIALTNILSDTQVNVSPPNPPQFDEIKIGLTPASVLTLIDAIQSTRAGQPTKMFRDPGDILGTTNLSTLSPWLNLSTSAQRDRGISDEAYEKIPTQLLPLLRLDSIGAIEPMQNGWLVSFSGYEGCSYVVETSSNLLTWSSAGTYQATNGSFSFTIPASSASGTRFYRSVLQ